MNNIISIQCNYFDIVDCTKRLSNELNQGNWVHLQHPTDKAIVIPKHLIPKGSGIIVSSSGSTGERHHCFHPFINLNQSAFATGEWLKEQEINPAKCHIFNPLPLHHVSGLMPWWRSRYWGVKHQWISPEIMRNPSELKNSDLSKMLKDNSTSLLLSLVPTQLQRLMRDPAGICWLKSFDIIWIGGGSLSQKLAQVARDEKIRLAPCYGTTETMAMVTALTPKDFLQGEMNVGSPLKDTELRLGKHKVLQIRTSRLATSIWVNGQMKSLGNSHNWWQSGDSAEILEEKVKILGRIDNAINSGGETIFPDKLQEQLLDSAIKENIPIHSLYLISTEDEEWGHRLVALVKLNEDFPRRILLKIFKDLRNLVKTWLPAEKPSKWYLCQNLAPNAFGKWDQQKWILWVNTEKPII